MMTKDHELYKDRKKLGWEKRKRNVEEVIEGMNLMPVTIDRLMLPFMTPQAKYMRRKRCG